MQWYANRDITVGLLKRKKREERDFRALEPHAALPQMYNSAGIRKSSFLRVLGLK
jgi:hypothetical protein